MKRLLRTQICLPAALSASLDRLARLRGTSRAELLRQAAREYLRREEPSDEDPIRGIVGLGNAGDGAISVEHDSFMAGLHGTTPRS